MLLFSLVALELAVITGRSAQDGKFAFLSPFVRSSKVQFLNERLQELMKAKDTRNLKALLIETEVIDGTERTFEKLQDLEFSIIKDLELHYNRILRYLPDDLKAFFEAYKILWDVKNLKSLLCLTLRHRLTDSNFVRTAGPFGYIDSPAIRSLAESGNPKTLLENAMHLLPAGFSPDINFEKKLSTSDLGFYLDVAAFEYLQQKSTEIGTKQARKAWNLVSGIYEVKNLVTIARLKYSGESTEIIRRFLFPSQGNTNDALVERLLESEDYTAFLHALRMTPYGEFIPEEMADPSRLEDSLEDGLKMAESNTRFTQRDMEFVTTVRFLTRLETTYDVIREAAFFSIIKDQHGS